MIEELRTRFRGALLRPGEEGYDEARRVWNGEIDRRPALIARVAGPDDVARVIAGDATGLDVPVPEGLFEGTVRRLRGTLAERTARDAARP